MTVSLSYRTATLDLLVHNLGRIARLWPNARIDRLPDTRRQEADRWEMFPLAYDSPPELPKGGPAKGTRLLQGYVHLAGERGNFLDMTKWGFGGPCGSMGITWAASGRSVQPARSLAESLAEGRRE